jgi:hypothetical protein
VDLHGTIKSGHGSGSLAVRRGNSELFLAVGVIKENLVRGLSARSRRESTCKAGGRCHGRR